MIRYKRSKSSMFLLEILINVLLFSILCVCSLQFFIKAYQLSENTTTLHQAVTACSSVASIYEAGNGSLEPLFDAYPYAIHVNEQTLIFFDENYNECSKNQAAYYILIEKSAAPVNAIDIRFYKNGEDACYSIQACSYQPLTPSSAKEVAGHE